MSIEAMKQALVAFEDILSAESRGFGMAYVKGYCGTMIRNLRQAIEEAEKQEPVAWMETELSKDADGLLREKVLFSQDGHGVPIYTTPPKREWVGLTDDEYEELLETKDWGGSLIAATEAKLKEKNT